nr:reverse transcriptase domain-containing protein [Tanacetum cinerariifolium]
KPERKDTQLPQLSVPTESVADEAVYKELDDRLVRAAITASSLEAEQDSGGGPKCQEAMRDTIAQTRFENMSKLSNGSLLARGNTLQSDEDRLKLNELRELCTNLQLRVLDLEKTKTTQALEITSLKKRVNKLEKKQRSGTHKLRSLYKVGLTATVDSSEVKQNLGKDASKQGRKINEIDADEDITLVNAQDDAKMFDVNDLRGESTRRSFWMSTWRESKGEAKIEGQDQFGQDEENGDICEKISQLGKSETQRILFSNESSLKLREYCSRMNQIAKPLILLTQKNKTYVWGDKQEEDFRILKEKLCNAPVLALLDGPNDFVVYCDASNQGFGCVLMQRGKKELNMHQKRWIELLNDYECEIKYHPGKANVVADALNRKERLKLRRLHAMSMTIHFGLKIKILAEQREAAKDLKAPVEWLQGLDTQFEKQGDEGIYFIERIWISSVGGLVLWLGMKKDIAEYRALQKTLGTRLDMSTTYHYQTDGQSERIIQTLEDMLRECVVDFGGSWDTHLPLVEFFYNNSYHKSIKCEPFEALYGRKCRSPVIWAEEGESQLIGPEIVQETTKKIMQIKERLKTARRPFEIVECVGLVVYHLKLPQELSCVHDVFHVSNLKKCLADSDLQVPLEEIKIDDKLYFVEEPVKIIDRQVKKLKRSWIPIVKVRWILEEELNLLGSEKINSKPSTRTFSPCHRLLPSSVELQGPEFP